MSGAIEGKGLGDPKRLPKKSKKSGVELDPELQTTRGRDAAALMTMVNQKPGSTKEGFDAKPALPPHRRPK